MKKGYISGKFLCIIFFSIFPFILSAQITKIMGTITDAKTGEALPFVNIIVPHTLQGTLTDFNGNFSMEIKGHADSIRASLVGYQTIREKIVLNQFQTFDIKMVPANIELSEVTIVYKGNPAEVILKKIIQNKEKNSLQSFASYQYSAYTKVELDANNISEKVKERKLTKPFGFIFNYVDTSIINGKSYLPVFFTETYSDIYFRKNPRARKEIIKATRSSGLEDVDFTQFIGNLSQEVDIYRNYISLFEKNFVSPIADFSIDYYKYYLVDSLYMGKYWTYHIMFKPRHRQTLTFTGNLWVADTTFAILKVEMRVADDANINFINDLLVEQEFQWTADKYWLLTKDYMVADFNLIDNAKKMLGFYGHRTSIYNNFSFDQPESKKYFSLPANVVVDPHSKDKDETYWENTRPEPLSRSEKGVYVMTDSVQKIPLFKTYVDFLYAIFAGYITWGKFELGPWYSIYSFNGVEGNRLKFGARTGNNFSKNVQLEGYAAYGFLDKTLKYGGDILYLYSKNPRRGLQVAYKFDVEQLGASMHLLNPDNIIASVFHRGSNDKLTMVREYRFNYEHEWFTGFSNTISLIHREMYPLGQKSFVLYPKEKATPDSVKQIFTSEVRIDFRFSFHERYISGQFYRTTVNSPYPIIQISYAYGFPKLIKNDFEYHRLNLTIRQWFNFATIGWSRYILETGKIWGTVPYPLLKIHEGNQTFFFDEYSSNLMNYYEFVSDAYISAYYTHHFEGLLFNKIPLLRKLKWRETAQIRGVYGTLTSHNANFSLFPDRMRSFGKKIYWETGTGIENIFKFFRIDAIWRLSHLNDKENPNVPKFGIFVSANFSF